MQLQISKKDSDYNNNNHCFDSLSLKRIFKSGA